MKTPVSERLFSQIEQFRLRYTCESCEHFDAELAACVHGYPADAHRLAPSKERAEIIFCKEFTLA